MVQGDSIKLTFPNKLEYSYLVQQFVREIAKMIGFTGDELNKIDIALEEAVSNVMIHTRDEGNPTFDIICDHIAGGIRIIIKEMGIPFNPEGIKKYEVSGNLDDLSTSGLGIYLIQNVMDHLEFHNLGTQGKETIMIKFLPDEVRKGVVTDQQAGNKEPAVIKEKIDYTVRALAEEEAIEVSRCAYKTHGYTFFDDHIYFRKIVEMNKKHK